MIRLIHFFTLIVAGILSNPAMFCQTSDKDSMVVWGDTITVIGERSSIFSPENVRYQRKLFLSPGGFHDPLRALSMIPQSAIVSDMQAQPTIGGDDPDRILTLVDGFEIIAPYRFLGAFSIFNPLMIRSVNATATGYPVRYGGFFPSAVEVQSENEYLKNPLLTAELTPPISQAVVGLPLKQQLGLSARLGLRSSHIFAFRPMLSTFTKDKRFDMFFPDLKDIQWGITLSPSEIFNLHQMGIVAEEKGSLQSFDRTFSYSWTKLFQGISFHWRPHENWELTSKISFHNNNAELFSRFPLESLGEQTFAMYSGVRQTQVHSEANVNASDKTRLGFGMEFSQNKSEQLFMMTSEYLRVPPSATTSFYDAAVFIEPRLLLWNWFELTFGERLWYSQFIRNGGNESRVSGVFRLSTSNRLEVGFGQYSQPPSDAQVLHGYLSLLAQPNQPPRLLLMSHNEAGLSPERSDVFFGRMNHTFLGFSSLAGIASIEIYQKKEQSIILSQRYPSVFTPIDSSSFQPSQRFEGNKWGVGLLLLLSQFSTGVSASVSVALQRSTITDLKSTDRIPAGSDRQILFKASVEFEKSNWSISATYQHYSGVPTTDRYFLQSTGVLGDSFFVPVWKNLNTSRLPPYTRLDFFVSKTFGVGSWSLAPYIDIVNVLNSKNMSHYVYTLNETKPPEFVNKSPVYNSLPFFPMVGVRLKKEW